MSRRKQECKSSCKSRLRGPEEVMNAMDTYGFKANMAELDWQCYNYAGQTTSREC